MLIAVVLDALDGETGEVNPVPDVVLGDGLGSFAEVADRE